MDLLRVQTPLSDADTDDLLSGVEPISNISSLHSSPKHSPNLPYQRNSVSPFGSRNDNVRVKSLPSTPYNDLAKEVSAKLSEDLDGHRSRSLNSLNQDIGQGHTDSLRTALFRNGGSPPRDRLDISGHSPNSNRPRSPRLFMPKRKSPVQDVMSPRVGSGTINWGTGIDSVKSEISGSSHQPRSPVNERRSNLRSPGSSRSNSVIKSTVKYHPSVDDQKSSTLGISSLRSRNTNTQHNGSPIAVRRNSSLPARSYERNTSVSPRTQKPRSLSPHHRVSERHQSPAGDQPWSPSQNRGRSPVRDRSASPVRVHERPSSPLRERPLSPSRARSPVTDRSRSPRLDRVRSPVHERPRSPVQQRSPLRLRSQSPDRPYNRVERPRSPIRETSTRPSRYESSHTTSYHSSRSGADRRPVDEMEKVRSHLNNMLKTGQEAAAGHLDEVNHLLSHDTRGSESYTHRETDSIFSKAFSDLSPQFDSVLSLSKAFSGPSSSRYQNDSTLFTENQQMRESLEKERYRRKHCEKQIQQLQSKLLETQQQLAVAVSTDKKRDVMIEQLDKTLAKVVEGWKKREAEMDGYIKQLTEEKSLSQQEHEKQQEMIIKFEQELAAAVEDLAKAQKRAAHAEAEKETQISQHKHEQISLKEALDAEHEHARRMETERDRAMEGRDHVMKQVEGLQRTLNEERHVWQVRESELSTQLDELTGTHMRAVEQEKAKSEDQARIAKETQEVLNSVQREVQQLKLDLDTVTRDRDHIKVEMGLMEARLENSKRKLEADMQSDMEKQLTEKLQEAHDKMSKSESEIRESHRKHVQELNQRHGKEMEQQLAQFHEEMRRKEEKFKEQIQNYEGRLSESRAEMTHLREAKQKLEYARRDIAAKMQDIMSSHCSEALSIMGGSNPYLGPASVSQLSTSSAAPPGQYSAPSQPASQPTPTLPTSVSLPSQPPAATTSVPTLPVSGLDTHRENQADHYSLYSGNTTARLTPTGQVLPSSGQYVEINRHTTQQENISRFLNSLPEVNTAAIATKATNPVLAAPVRVPHPSNMLNSSHHSTRTQPSYSVPKGSQYGARASLSSGYSSQRQSDSGHLKHGHIQMVGVNRGGDSNYGNHTVIDSQRHSQPQKEQHAYHTQPQGHGFNTRQHVPLVFNSGQVENTDGFYQLQETMSSFDGASMTDGDVTLQMDEPSQYPIDDSASVISSLRGDDYGPLSDRLEEHQTRQNELQHYIKMLLERSPGSPLDNEDQSRQQLSHQGKEESAMFSQLKSRPTPQNQVQYSKQGSHHPLAFSKTTVTSTKKPTGIAQPAGHREEGGQVPQSQGTLSPAQVGEISRLLGMYRDNPEQSQNPPVEEVLTYLKNLQASGQLPPPPESHATDQHTDQYHDQSKARRNIGQSFSRSSEPKREHRTSSSEPKRIPASRGVMKPTQTRKPERKVPPMKPTPKQTLPVWK